MAGQIDDWVDGLTMGGKVEKAHRWANGRMKGRVKRNN